NKSLEKFTSITLNSKLIEFCSMEECTKVHTVFPLPHEFSGVLAKNDFLDKSERILQNQISGPESIAVYKGVMYTGTLDGKIVRINEDENKCELITQLIACGNDSDGKAMKSQCGRPLGLRFNERGSLFIIDAYSGLWKIDNVYDYPKTDIIKNNLLPLRDVRVGCRESVFLDDLVIDGNTVYISDVSGKWNLGNVFLAKMEPETDGRIIKYDISSGKAEVILSQLWTPKGIELTDNRDALLICETVKRRVLKHYLSGSKAGKTEVFSDALPGEPENIRRGTEKTLETYWITISAARSIREPSTHDYLNEYPTVRLFVIRFLYAIGFLAEFAGNKLSLQPLRETGESMKTGKIVELITRQYTVVAELDYQGLIVSTYQSSTIFDLTEAREVRINNGNRYLYIGSNSNQFIVKLSLTNSTTISENLRYRRHHKQH
ncbi:Adipocyte plasma membrane-associated protein-like protein, partial [Leptotrombidium deliense]